MVFKREIILLHKITYWMTRKVARQENTIGVFVFVLEFSNERSQSAKS